MEETTLTDGASASPSPIARGALVGRYVVLDRIGAGAMGVVFAAYDPELDRKVALKLLRPRGGATEIERARLQREAQALARLSHPNAVAVHDVGVHDESVFIAMELVAGETLRDWQAAHPRTWRETVEVYRDAGRGLAAAHAAGVIHRDFKPDNVMIAGDGRVRVMDFGLAITGDELGTGQSPAGEEPDFASSAESVRLTQTGRLLGTPAYMSPEHFAGEEITAASDQFSFCIAMFEGLYGERPFQGDTLGALALASTEGRVHWPADVRQVPGWLRQVVARGLKVEPRERFASMEALLVELAAGALRQRRRRGLVAVGALAAVLGVGLGAVELREVALRRECDQSSAAIDAVWNDEIREEFRAAILSSGAAWAPTAAASAVASLDEYTRALQDLRRDACVDAMVERRLDLEEFERVTWCLDERAEQLEATVTEFASSELDAVRRVAAATDGLDPALSCRDPIQLAQVVPTSHDDESARQVRRLLAEAHAIESRGDYARALEVATRAAERAADVGSTPSLAAATMRQGWLFTRLGRAAEAEETLEEAYFLAAHAGNDAVAASSATSLVYVVGVRQSRSADGERWARHAGLHLDSLGEPKDSNLRQRLQNHLALLHRTAGDLDRAAEEFEALVSSREATMGPEHPDVAVALGNLASTLQNKGSLQRASRLHQRALEIRRAALGGDHPDVGATLNNLAGVAYQDGDYPRAAELYGQAIDVRERALGGDHEDVAASLNNLANVWVVVGDHRAAKTAYARALRIWEAGGGEDDLKCAAAHTGLGNVEMEFGNADEARQHYDHALRIWETLHGPEHAQVAVGLKNLASCRRHLGEPQAALALLLRAGDIERTALGDAHPEIATTLSDLGSLYLELDDAPRALEMQTQALAIWESNLGNDHPDVAYALDGLAAIALAQDDPVAAIRHAQRAIDIREAKAIAPAELAQSQFLLARALWRASPPERDRKRALALARDASAALRDAQDDDAGASDVEKWLRTPR